MKNKILMFLIIIICLISIIFSILSSNLFNNDTTYMVVCNDTLWKYNKTWKKVNINNLKKLSYKPAYIYNGYNQIINNSYFEYKNGELDIYDENYEKQDLTPNTISVIGNNKINVANVQIMDSINEYDEVYVDEVLSKYSINNPGDNYNTYKAVYDLNNDGKEDYVFNINNFYTQDKKDYAFSIIFSVINGEIKIVEKQIVSVEQELAKKSLYLTNIVDVDNDKNYEIIIFESSYGNVKNDCHSIYKYENNQYKKLIGCQEE